MIESPYTLRCQELHDYPLPFPVLGAVPKLSNNTTGVAEHGCGAGLITRLWLSDKASPAYMDNISFITSNYLSKFMFITQRPTRRVTNSLSGVAIPCRVSARGFMNVTLFLDSIKNLGHLAVYPFKIFRMEEDTLMNEEHPKRRKSVEGDVSGGSTQKKVPPLNAKQPSGPPPATGFKRAEITGLELQAHFKRASETIEVLNTNHKEKLRNTLNQVQEARKEAETVELLNDISQSKAVERGLIARGFDGAACRRRTLFEFTVSIVPEVWRAKPESADAIAASVPDKVMDHLVGAQCKWTGPDLKLVFDSKQSLLDYDEFMKQWVQQEPNAINSVFWDAPKLEGYPGTLFHHVGNRGSPGRYPRCSYRTRLWTAS